MRMAVDEALAGRGNLLFLVGEPGIGKTRAAEELATFAGVSGARVAWGRCHEDERAPAFWPWIEAIREFVRDADPVGLRWQLGPRAPDVARLVPELAERLGEHPEPLAADQRGGPVPPLRLGLGFPGRRLALAAPGDHPRRPSLGRRLLARAAAVRQPPALGDGPAAASAPTATSSSAATTRSRGPSPS